MRGARIFLAGMLLSLPCAFALNPAFDVSQYSHKSWAYSDGFVRGTIPSISQTPDGYLWLATESGLVRFDGVRTTDWKPPHDPLLPSHNVTKLLAARDGTLWIGTDKGLCSWKDGRLGTRSAHPSMFPWSRPTAQTDWFRAECLAAFLALMGALYQLRLQYVKRQFNLRLEERVAERTRIARDLHDTLLQSFQGVLLRFHAVTFKLPDRSEVRADLEAVIEAARVAITEGRDAVQGLRSSTVISNDLARSIGALAEELAGEQADGKCPQFRVRVEGKTRDLPPLVRDEVYRTAAEAMRNAFRHASARRIEVDIHYDKRQFGLRVRDDGKGIDQHVLDEGGRTGHHGLPGMHERAKLVGGKLAVWSELDSGTEIELTIPAVLAHAKTEAARESSASGKGT